MDTYLTKCEFLNNIYSIHFDKMLIELVLHGFDIVHLFLPLNLRLNSFYEACNTTLSILDIGSLHNWSVEIIKAYA